MKILLILILLISGCTIKEDPQPDEIETPEPEVIVRGTHDDFVVLKEAIQFEDHDLILQDYYSNSLALFKNNELVAFYNPHGDNLIAEDSICSVMMRNFHFDYVNPADPGILTLTCDGIRHLYAYSDDFKMIYHVGSTAPDYPIGLVNTIRMIYILKNSPIVKEIDIYSYLHRGPGDPLIIKDYEQFSANGILPVYELEREPALIDDVLTFDLTGVVGIVTAESTRSDILESLKFQGVGADTSTPDGLISVIIDGKLGLAQRDGTIVIEPQYDPVVPLSNQIFSENFQIKQTGPQVKAFQIDHFILDYWTNTYFVGASSQASGFRPVVKEGKVGFLDEAGQELDTFYFDFAYVGLTNRIWVKTGETFSIIEVGKDIGYQQQDLLSAFNNEASQVQALSQRYLNGEICDDSLKLYEVTSETGLYIRDGANLESGFLGVFNYQQKVCGISEGEWIKFDYNGTDGYLYREYTQLVNP